MTGDGRLSVAILTKDVRRALNIMDSLAKRESLNGTVKFNKVCMRLYAKGVIYSFVIPINHDYMGVEADQVILDRVDGNDKIAARLLARSCVPAEYQIINDRELLLPTN